MGAKFKLKIQRNILLIIIGFTAIVCAGVIYSSNKSLKLDEEHLALIEELKNLDIEIAHSRIFLDDYFIFQDSLKRSSIVSSLEGAKSHIVSLETLVSVKYEGYQKSNLLGILLDINGQVTELTQKVLLGLKENAKSIDTAILDDYNDFQIVYQKLDKDIHDYILNENVKFKKDVFNLVFVIFILLVLSLILVYILIKAYNKVEKKQAIKAIEIEYKERKRIAVELHDGLGSVLSSIMLFVKLIEKDNADIAIGKKLDKLKDLSSIALDNLEAAINNLNPSNLNRYGLIKSLEIICDGINDTGKVFCRLVKPKTHLELDANFQINLYKVCSELINNTLKHSNATELYIDIKNEKNTLNLIYKDNGVGFNSDLIYALSDEKMGLRSIVNRVESLGGRYQINSWKGNGLEVLLSFKT